MIQVMLLNGKNLSVNCDHIVFLEETPDTILTLADGQKLVVKDSRDLIVEKIIEYKAKCLRLGLGKNEIAEN